MNTVFFIFLGIASLFIFWRIFITFKSFGIVISGLQKPYIVFVAHSINIFLLIIAAISILETNHDGNSCWIHGAILAFAFNLGNLLVTLFGFLKIQFYKTFYQLNVTQRQLLVIVKFLLLFWFFIQIPFRLVVFEIVVDDSNYGCNYVKNKATNCAILLMYLLFISAHCIIFSLSWQLRNVHNEDFPQLRTQIKLNLTVVPAIFFSTIIFHAIAQMWVRLAGFPNIEVMFTILLFDQIVNNVIMYITVYIDDTWTLASIFDLGFVDFLAPNSNMEQEDEIGVIETFWVKVPGGHPIRASWEEIDSHDLWDQVITNESQINQRKKYEKRGCLFRWCLKVFIAPINEETVLPKKRKSLDVSRIACLYE